VIPLKASVLVEAFKEHLVFCTLQRGRHLFARLSLRTLRVDIMIIEYYLIYRKELEFLNRVKVLIMEFLSTQRRARVLREASKAKVAAQREAELSERLNQVLTTHLIKIEE
jgi:hypothetical protein